MFDIVGLTYVSDYLNLTQHSWLLQKIDKETWLTDLKRRTQHYGYKYDYTKRKIDPSMKVGPLPDWAEILGKKLVTDGYFNSIPDQLIVNEYIPGQGIANHIDCVPCFGDTIVSISLNSPCVMELTNKKSGTIVPLLLEPRSLLCLEKDARYLWTHGIPARTTDEFDGRIINRSRRVSLTFRKVKL